LILLDGFFEEIDHLAGKGALLLFGNLREPLLQVPGTSNMNFGGLLLFIHGSPLAGWKTRGNAISRIHEET